MKIKLFGLLALSLMLAACKKDEEETTTTGGSSGGNTSPVTPTTVEVELTMDGQTYNASFGGLGSSMQYTSATSNVTFDSLALTPSTAMSVVSLSSDISYAAITLPAALVSAVDWADDPAQVFIDYFNDEHPIIEEDFGNVFFILNDGSSWTSNNPSVSGDWNISHVVEENTSPALVRCQGNVTIDLYNAATNVTQEAQVSYVMKFQEPF